VVADLVEGSITAALPDDITIPEKAGKLSKEEVKRLPKVRKGLGLACQMTAAAMVKNPDRLNVPGVTADGLAAAGLAADGIDSHVIDAENITLTLKQANLLLNAGAHNFLRRVLAHVRKEAKFGDPRILDLVPTLIAYFSNEPAGTAPPDPGA
jgi:hypothetical protein